MFEEIVEGFIRGEKNALSRAISFVERNPEKSHLLISEISKRTGRNLLSEDVHIIGITGPAGIGKSTIISQLIKKTKGGVLLCDPSSVRVEGGAILGDRIRIHAESATESNGVFIRSVGTRGEFGGDLVKYRRYNKSFYALWNEKYNSRDSRSRSNRD